MARLHVFYEDLVPHPGILHALPFKRLLLERLALFVEIVDLALRAGLPILIFYKPGDSLAVEGARLVARHAFHRIDFLPAALECLLKAMLIGLYGATADVRIGKIGAEKAVTGSAYGHTPYLLQDRQINPLVGIAIGLRGVGPAHKGRSLGIRRVLREQHHLVGHPAFAAIVFPQTTIDVFLLVIVFVAQDDGEPRTLVVARIFEVASLKYIVTRRQRIVRRRAYHRRSQQRAHTHAYE